MESSSINLPQSFKLSNGITMPSVGLGTYQMNEGELGPAIAAALDAGYRMFDTAANYKNEGYIGRILQRELALRGMTRADIFIITKLSPKDQGYDRTVKAIAKSAALLGGYIDLFLIHWPGVSKTDPASAFNAVCRRESWLAMQDVYSGSAAQASTLSPASPSPDALDARDCARPQPPPPQLVRVLGVSNYQVRHLEELLADPALRVPPAVNQVERHPCHHPQALDAFCAAHGIHLQAYSPLGRGELLTQEFSAQFPEVLRMVGEAVSPEASAAALPCVFLKWGLQRGHSVIPKSKSCGRIRDNISMLGIAGAGLTGTRSCGRPLTDEELFMLDRIQETRSEKYCWDSQSIA
jgi:diketogulonate reductase-like aldo/keto reductase